MIAVTRILLSAALLATTALPAFAESVNVAVAANFTAVSEELAALFEAETGHEVVLSFGATGQLYTQITQAAPFGVFLAADIDRPQRAIDEGFGVEGTFFVYAEGRLALYGPGRDLSDGRAALGAEFGNLAVADPQAAPYGAAAVETMTALGLYDALEPRIVWGENISQTLQFIESGNAELGFVAASQVLGKTDQWIVPAELHEPIAQGAVLLKEGENNPAALALVDFLRSETALAVIEAAGYSVP
ncbi:molybdate ABC transporter substrate-binding protein [Devosia sp. YIM 151766]|uniref:molybdate ABC transporter substrate-binding protein n=1 Tax=Devosia sp. YIM 151766 TaxID=3017325 RepID=UPI00255C577D|nr:molybdate ABC transporter substrate-binding protein [Devosia sp. YIM 151766]WIY54539.1 molybdate ABC transporter substrate-binding protein [Devosia sp. YIM 151766]